MTVSAHAADLDNVFRHQWQPDSDASSEVHKRYIFGTVLLWLICNEMPKKGEMFERKYTTNIGDILLALLELAENNESVGLFSNGIGVRVTPVSASGYYATYRIREQYQREDDPALDVTVFRDNWGVKLIGWMYVGGAEQKLRQMIDDHHAT